MNYKTILEQTDDNWDFLLGDYNNDGILDLYCIKKFYSGTNSTEVHILNGSNGFQSFLFQKGTPISFVGDDYQFLLGDYNNNGKLDLYCIKKYDTESKKTEVRVLDGNNNYQTFLLEKPIITPLIEVGDCFEFGLGDYNNNGILDLYCIKKFGTKSGKIEVSILDGNNNFQSFLLKDEITCLEEIDDDCQFGISDYNNNGIPDIYCIKKNNTGTQSTEVYILDGSNNYKSFLLQTGTHLSEKNENYSFYIIKKKLFIVNKKGDNCTEVDLLVLKNVIKDEAPAIPIEN